MSEIPEIVGICLVRDEDAFLDRVLRNTAGFCDRLMIADHMSSDGTAEIGLSWAKADPRYSYHRIRTPPESQALLEPYINTPTWVFAVDGDEIYDPAGLDRLRSELKAGRHGSHLRIYGNVLHCVELDESRRVASGYLSPPSRTMTKLYNFASISEWRGPCTERLHGGTPVLRPEFAAAKPLELYSMYRWDESPFRCLHTVFLRRSSRQAGSRPRPNIAEQDEYNWLRRLRHRVLGMFGRTAISGYKHEKYRVGERVTVDVSAFFLCAAGVPVGTGAGQIGVDA